MEQLSTFNFPVAGPSASITVALSALFFGSLHLLVIPLTKYLYPDLMDKLERRNKALSWRNYMVSFTFVSLCSLFFLYILYEEGRYIFSDVVRADSDLCRALAVFGLGYFVADTVDMWVGGSLGVDMIIHHGVIIVGFGSFLWVDKHAGYIFSVLICETNTVFLHARKLMLLAGLSKESRAYGPNLACLLGGFPFQRVIPHLYLLNKVFADMENFAAPWMFWVAFIGLLAINILNFLLLKTILSSEREYILSRFSQSKLGTVLAQLDDKST